jgi:hypothetical protein
MGLGNRTSGWRNAWRNTKEASDGRAVSGDLWDESMALSAFDDKLSPPRDDQLAKTLGRASAAWNALRKAIAERFGPLSEEWGFAGKNAGWGLRLKRPSRTVLYMTPCNGYFLASFALGEKAVKAAHESDLPASILQIIDGAKKYVEGRAVRLEVRSVKDVGNVEKIAVIKMAN